MCNKETSIVEYLNRNNLTDVEITEFGHKIYNYYKCQSIDELQELDITHDAIQHAESKIINLKISNLTFRVSELEKGDSSNLLTFVFVTALSVIGGIVISSIVRAGLTTMLRSRLLTINYLKKKVADLGKPTQAMIDRLNKLKIKFKFSKKGNLRIKREDISVIMNSPSLGRRIIGNSVAITESVVQETLQEKLQSDSKSNNVSRSIDISDFFLLNKTEVLRQKGEVEKNYAYILSKIDGYILNRDVASLKEIGKVIIDIEKELPTRPNSKDDLFPKALILSQPFILSAVFNIYEIPTKISGKQVLDMEYDGWGGFIGGDLKTTVYTLDSTKPEDVRYMMNLLNELSKIIYVDPPPRSKEIISFYDKYYQKDNSNYHIAQLIDYLNRYKIRRFLRFHPMLSFVLEKIKPLLSKTIKK